MLNYTLNYIEPWLPPHKPLFETETDLDAALEAGFDLDFDLSPGSALDFERDGTPTPDFDPDEPLDPESHRADARRTPLSFDLDFPDLDLSNLNIDLDLPELGMDLYCLGLDLDELDQDLAWDEDDTEMDQDKERAEEEAENRAACLAISGDGRPALKPPALSSRAAPAPALAARRASPARNANESEAILTISVHGLTLGGAVSAVACAIRKKRMELESDLAATCGGKLYRWRFLGLYNNHISYRAELIRSRVV